MKYHQRNIVEVSSLFPDGTFKPHPAIIVSNDELQEDEEILRRDRRQDYRFHLLGIVRTIHAA